MKYGMKVSYGKTAEMSETSAKFRQPSVLADEKHHEEGNPHQEQKCPAQAGLLPDKGLSHGPLEDRRDPRCPRDPFVHAVQEVREQDEEEAEQSRGDASSEGERAQECQGYQLVHRMPFLSLAIAFRPAMVQL